MHEESFAHLEWNEMFEALEEFFSGNFKVKLRAFFCFIELVLEIHFFNTIAPQQNF
jgi:hypothetical protein